MVQENIFHLQEKGTSILYSFEKIRSFLVMTSFFEKVSIIFSFLRVFTFLPTLMLYIYWHKPSSGTFECRSPTFQWKPSNSLQCQVYWMFSLWFFMPTITTRNLATTTAKSFSFSFWKPSNSSYANNYRNRTTGILFLLYASLVMTHKGSPQTQKTMVNVGILSQSTYPPEM